jgi:Tfp pilus assembly protein PilF
MRDVWEAPRPEALRACEASDPAGHYSANSLAKVLQARGDHKAAEEHFRRVLVGREKVLGKEHPDTLTSVNNLGAVLQAQGDYKTAEEHHRRALAGWESVLGKEHPNTLTSANNLAVVL